jgi:hypothetical protein
MFVHLLIFIIILFLYLHITDQYKKGEDLEVYEMDYIDNPQLQEVCNVKQPIVFDSPNYDFFEKMKTNLDTRYGNYEVNVKDTADYEKAVNVTHSIDSIMLPLQSTQNLMTTDTQSHYFSEENQPFLEETGLNSFYESMDVFLKPAFTVSTTCDLWFGSKDTKTPFRYHTHYRRFLSVVSGSIQLKVSPWRSTKLLNPIKDYEHYDFRSITNPWSQDTNSLKTLDIFARAGQIIYIPPYWWYSIQYLGETPPYVCTTTYHSAMNLLAHTPDLVFYYLQNQNIQKKYTKVKEPSLESEEVYNVEPIDSKKSEIITNVNDLPTPPPTNIQSAKDATLELTQTVVV